MRRIKKRNRRKLFRFFVIISLLFMMIIVSLCFLLEILFKAKHIHALPENEWMANG